jgi:4-hydroxybenzoate polyprenyltransferase
LLKKIKELIKEGNVREITIENKEGRTILVLPLTVGIIGAALLPPLAAVGAIAALLTECTLRVTRSK